MTKPLVTVFTLAYNAENYISETIESVLNQSETNIEYIIRNNGSTDKTGEVIESYAKKDSRISVLYNEVNCIKEDGTALEFYEQCTGACGEYITLLDSDDYLDTDFIKKMYFEACLNDADITISGTNFFNDGSKTSHANRIPPKINFNYSKGDVLSAKEFEGIYGSVRPLWGKLYNLDFFNKYKKEVLLESRELRRSGDTGMSLAFLRKANIVTSHNEALHYYRIRKNSHYNAETADGGRISDGKVLFKMGMQTAAKFGISKDSIMQFLVNIHYHHLNDIMLLCQESTVMTFSKKLYLMQQILNDDLLGQYGKRTEKIILDPFIKTLESEIDLTNDDVELKDQAFLLRITNAQGDSLKISNSLRLTYLMSGILDMNNKFNWGQYLIEDRKSDFLGWNEQLDQLEIKEKMKAFSDYSTFNQMVSGNSSEDERFEFKNQILEALEQGDVNNAKLNLEQLFELNPLDRETLYLALYVSFYMEDRDSLFVLKSLVSVYWPADDELNSIIYDIENQRR